MRIRVLETGLHDVSSRRLLIGAVLALLVLVGATGTAQAASGTSAPAAAGDTSASYTDCVANVVTPPYRVGDEVSGVGEVRCANNPGSPSVEVCMERSSYRGYVEMHCSTRYASGPPSEPVFAQEGAGGALLAGTYNYRLKVTSTAPNPFGPPELDQELSASYTITR